MVVYKDLLTFYHAVVQILSREHVVLAWISEQFNEKVPPVVHDFLQHAEDLHSQINSATFRIAQSIEDMVLDTKSRSSPFPLPPWKRKLVCDIPRKGTYSVLILSRKDDVHLWFLRRKEHA